jgi:hypothetical protein
VRRSICSLLAVCIVSSFVALSVLAQAPPQPPRVLVIYREEVKSGMSAAHAKVEAGWPRAFARAGATNYYVGMTSRSGPNEAWFLEPHDSYAAFEKSNADIARNPQLSADLDKLSADDGAVTSGGRNLIAVYQEELSRQGTSPFPLNRYVSVTTYRVRPGKAPEFTEFRRLLKSVNESGKTSNYFVIYQVVSGAPSGTYLLLRGLKSLKELDPDPSQPTFAQLLGPDNQKKLNDLSASFLISSEAALFELKPGMSYPPKEFLAVDSAFWAPKATPAKTVKVVTNLKKEPKKVASAQ